MLFYHLFCLNVISGNVCLSLESDFFVKANASIAVDVS